MSSQLLHAATRPISCNQTAKSHISTDQFLTQRIYIPSHVYHHPAALHLEHCTSSRELYQIIPLIIKDGLYHEVLFKTKLVSLFCNYGNLEDAARVFEADEDKLDVLYHTMLKGYAKFSGFDDSLRFFCQMRRDNVTPLVYNFTYLLKLCGNNGDLKRGKEIHAQVIKNGFSYELFATTALVTLYAKCGKIGEAHKVFDRMSERDLISWNTMVSGYVRNGMANTALELLSRMNKDNQKPNHITLVSVIPAVSDLKNIKYGKAVHGYALRSGISSYLNISSALVDMYSKCGSLGTARLIFDMMEERNVVSWNSMIDGYVQSGKAEEAMLMFRKMLGEGVDPTDVSFMGALHACADLGDFEAGVWVHKLLSQLKFESNISVMNSLISMYCKCSKVDMAADIFADLQSKSLVSWNAMILGFAQNGRAMEALKCFHDMQSQGMKLDTFTMVSVITAVADLSVANQAKWIHGCVVRSYLDKDVFVMTALVDMYAKCGAICTARKIFDAMEIKHVTTWNAMIDGYGTHGDGQTAVKLFEEMRKSEIRPNDVTFISVISACSHSGLVSEGLGFFTMMREAYSIEPSMDHYGAIVDLLGRAGRLKEAWNFICKMPMEPAINVYGAMLGACKIHKNVDFAEKAADRLFRLNPSEGGYHVLLANVYRTASMWDKVAKVRVSMERVGIKKTPGCSLVELGNQVHSFYSGSTSHPRSKDIYAYLAKLINRIKTIGYVPEIDSIHDVEDSVKEQLLASHSEKLAIAFGLLNTRHGSPIHVRKNLRVCGDCHSATKYISLVTEREIIVRDMQRFHHFKNGMCSCGDYW